jgi:hypothetical protein
VATSSSLVATLNSNESKNKMSIKAEIIAHFKANPEAKPIEVGKIFGASNGNVYNYRKEALGLPKKTRKVKIEKPPAKTWTDIAIEVAHVSNPRTPDYPWMSLGLHMGRNDVRGFLKGQLLILQQELDDTNFDADVQEMQAVLSKLKSMRD